MSASAGFSSRMPAAALTVVLAVVLAAGPAAARAAAHGAHSPSRARVRAAAPVAPVRDVGLASRGKRPAARRCNLRGPDRFTGHRLRG